MHRQDSTYRIASDQIASHRTVPHHTLKCPSPSPPEVPNQNNTLPTILIMPTSFPPFANPIYAEIQQKYSLIYAQLHFSQTIQTRISTTAPPSWPRPSGYGPTYRPRLHVP